MSKPQPKLGRRAGSPIWSHDKLDLSLDTRRALATALGHTLIGGTDFTDATLRAIHETEGILGCYPGALQAFDNAPRAADYRVTYRQLHRAVAELRSFIVDLPGFYRLRLREGDQGITEPYLQHFADDLERLADCCDRLMRGEASTSGGRPRSIAASLVIKKLRAIFAEHQVGADTRRQRHGFINKASMWEAREHAFIRLALKAAGIVVRDLPGILRTAAAHGSTDHSEPSGKNVAVG